MSSGPAFAQADAGLVADWAANGGGIVEVASPNGDVCPDLGVPGCLQFDGNTAWHDPNIDGDYYISGGGGDGSIDRLRRYVEAASPDDFVILFSDACSTPGTCYGVYAFGTQTIVSVPFEVWNTGETPDDPSDDIRLIPFINANDVELSDWSNQFTGIDAWPLANNVPITDWIYGMMPDRDNGYDLFAAAAAGFGGAGALYDPLADGDDQIDPDPANGGDCANQGYYANFCYRNDVLTGTYAGGTFGATFVYPIGRVVFADLAGDGTTPATGTAVTLISEDNAPTFADWASNGAGIVEVMNPIQAPCTDPAEAGCLEYTGNTVWHDPNVNDDYYISGGGGDGSIDRLRRYVETGVPDVFELRFTASGGYGVYGFAGFEIATVPFELWNIGDAADPADDVRMIPFLNANDVPLTSWADQFTGADAWALAAGTPITDWIYGMMPDRPDGYDLFEAAAIGFGGAGAIYDPLTDGDTQIDVSPFDGADCANQGVYADYCYRNDVLTDTYAGGTLGAQFVYPIGRVVFGDLAGDGTTPPEGTVIRMFTEGTPPVVSNEPGAEIPSDFVLDAVYPNPFNPRAVVPFSVPTAGAVRVAVYDILGREVAVLVNERLAAGHHEATLDGAGLSSGLYLVTLQADGVMRAQQKVTLLR